MSSIRQVLAHFNDSPHATQVLSLAVHVAGVLDASLAAVYAVDPPAPGAYLSAEAAALATQLTLQDQQARWQQARTRVEATVPGLPLESAEGDALGALLRRARCTDLLVLGQHDPQHPEGHAAGLNHRLLVSAGCPLLFVPYAMAREPAGPGRVLVAWSGTRESARALRDALPLLRRADQVELVHYAHAGTVAAAAMAPLQAHLERHGVRATCIVRERREPSLAERIMPGWIPDAPIAEALLSHAADIEADLIVMGGYGHPRAWELALGGVTRTLLQSMTVPVLMSH
jgi:nucleotide-binding universal stress UspA family protein